MTQSITPSAQAPHNQQMAILDNVGGAEAYLNQIEQFQRIVQTSLNDKTDFMKIGGNKTLLKPGAEKIFMILGVSCTFDIEEEVNKPDYYEVRIKSHAIKDGVIIAEGFGSCNSQEKKYAKQSVFDLHNTILKMATKRAKVDVALHIGALSNVFSQDLEDIDENNRRMDEVQGAKKASASDVNVIKALFETLGTSGENKAAILASFNSDSVMELTRDQAAALIKRMRQEVEKKQAAEAPEFSDDDIEFV